jgi:DNA polymerase II small subunit
VCDLEDNTRVLELAQRLSGIALVGSDISDDDIAGIDFEFAIARITAHFEGSGAARILTKEILELLLKDEEKEPVQIEVVRQTDFRPIAKEIDAKFSIRNILPEKTEGNVGSFVDNFKDRFERIKEMIIRNGRLPMLLDSLDKIKNYTNGREISIIGIVNNKIVTKNGNFMLNIEDCSSSAKVLFMKSGVNGSPISVANGIVYDDIIAIKGKVSGPFIIAESIVYPDIPIRARVTSEEDIAIGFLSDIHIGSKRFLEKDFVSFLKWLNNGVDYKKDLLGKIKYLVFAGDVVDGIGIYPNQDKDLAVLDVYKQYAVLMNFLELIPEYIHVFVLPGNHDAVHRAEPEPPIEREILGEIKRDNIHLLSNPSYVTLNGIKVLAYHGASLDSVIRYVPGCSYSKPETAMTETLRRRHLSPIYGGNTVIPSKTDSLVIDEVPDILHMGHLHKNGYAEYHGTLVINSGTWQDRTEYQIKQGHMPTPCVLPVYETKSAVLSEVNFGVL